FFSSRRRHTRLQGDWSSDVCLPIYMFGEARTENVSDAVKLLVIDHQKVERIFSELAASSSVAARQSMCAQLDAELSRHTAVEEQIGRASCRERVEIGACTVTVKKKW